MVSGLSCFFAKGGAGNMIVAPAPFGLKAEGLPHLFSSTPKPGRYLLYRACWALVPYIVGTWGVRDRSFCRSARRRRGAPCESTLTCHVARFAEFDA